MEDITRLFELKIEEDDPISGIDSISLVEDPAIEIEWLAFNKHKKTKELFVPEGEDQNYLDKLFEGGQPEQELLDDGWVITNVEAVNAENFALSPTKPNEESVDDTLTERIRYKYGLNDNIKQNPIISTTREYCRTLLNRNYVWRREELISLSPNSDPYDGGFGGDPMIWRGGYNCRHNWFKITYKKEGDIRNKASAKKNRITDVAGRAPDQPTPWVQPSTVTTKTRRNPSPETIRNLGLSKKKEGFQVKVEDKDKQIVLGPAMIPKMEILRVDDEGEPYYVYFSEETIRMIAEKYMKNGFNVSNDVDHNGKKIKDAYVIESWIKEDENDKSVKYGFGDLPIGTWFVSMKIKDDKIWKRVKDGELKGFSVSGYFEEVLIKMHEQQFIADLAKLLKMVKNK